MSTEQWPNEPEERRDAARRAFECDLPGTPDEFVELLDKADRRAWPEVARAALFGSLRHAAEPGGSDVLGAVEALRQRAAVDGDLDMLALALAWRGWLGATRGLGTGPMVDSDLARAAVMLEVGDGNPVVRTMAHFRLAFAHMHRSLWELADEQFEAAELMVDTVDPLGKDPLLHRAALAFDRVMVALDWGCTVRPVHGTEGARQRRQSQEDLVAAADCVDMPGPWREDVKVAGLLLDVIAGAPRANEVLEHLDRVERTGEKKMWEGYLHLALALSEASIGLERATTHIDKALATVDAAESRAAYDLALHQATVLEAAAAGRRTAGLRSAEELAAQREVSRAAAVTAARAAIASERLRNERDLLALHAYLDPLTGLGNRRGFDQHVAALKKAAVDQVAVLIFDVDRFKRVNDTLGHAAGDAVLRRVSEVLTANVRTGDFAARFGGDEFVLLLADLGQAAAQRRCQAIAEEIAGQAWHDVGPTLRVTVSSGVASGHPSTISDLCHQADAALYRAKACRAPLAASA